MKKIFALLAIVATLAPLSPLRAQTHIREEVGGYQIGRTPSEKFSLWGVWPPVPQQSGSNDLLQSLEAIGILSTSGTSPAPATPLNLNGGALQAGSVNGFPLVTSTSSPIAAATVANPGTLLLRTGSNSALYIKLSGTGGTGWGLVLTGTGP